MRIIILGAGGIGSLVGALLSKENDVLLIGRQAHADEINKNGLEISGCINKNFKVKAETKISKIDEDTLIILTTKDVDNEKTLNEVKYLIKENTIILCLQNGLGNEDLIKNIVNCKVIRGITTSGATFICPGKIKCSNIGEIYLEDSEVSGNACYIFNKSGFKTEVSKDIKQQIWKKLIVNCAVNPLTAILKVENGKLLKVLDLVRTIINESVMVAEKEGFKFDEKEVFEMVIDIIKDSAENQSSMLQDVLKGRKTEIDYLNGAVVEVGKKYEIKCPVNECLVMIIKGMEGENYD
ncbi:MAG: 2-dehydropantoate 2-reductase [Candidatus Woesearchaeota archaeon]